VDNWPTLGVVGDWESGAGRVWDSTHRDVWRHKELPVKPPGWFGGSRVEQIELGGLAGACRVLLVRACLCFDDVEPVQVENGGQCRTHVALRRVPRDSPVHFEPRKTLAVEEGNGQTRMIVPRWIENAVNFQVIRMLVDFQMPDQVDSLMPRGAGRSPGSRRRLQGTALPARGLLPEPARRLL